MGDKNVPAFTLVVTAFCLLIKVLLGLPARNLEFFSFLWFFFFDGKCVVMEAVFSLNFVTCLCSTEKYLSETKCLVLKLELNEKSSERSIEFFSDVKY